MVDNLLSRFAKTAENESSQDLLSAQVRQRALGDVINTALAGVGLGVGARGLMGLYNLARRTSPSITSKQVGQQPVPFPVPMDEEPEDEKFASAGFLLGGDNPTTPWGIPAYGPALLTAGVGGPMAGWKIMDRILDSRRKGEQEDELAAAKRQFEEALLHTTTRGKRAGEASELAVELEALYEETKQAMAADTPGQKQAGNALGGSLGIYGMYALATGVPAAMLAYNKALKGSSRKIMEKAVKKRQRARYQNRPYSISAVPFPMASPQNKPMEEEEESFQLPSRRRAVDRV